MKGSIFIASSNVPAAEEKVHVGGYVVMDVGRNAFGRVAGRSAILIFVPKMLRDKMASVYQ